MAGGEVAAVAENLVATAAAVRHGARVAAETIVTALCHAAGERRTGPWEKQLEHFLVIVAQRRKRLGDAEPVSDLEEGDRAELVEDSAAAAIAGVQAELVDDLAAAADLEEGDRVAIAGELGEDLAADLAEVELGKDLAADLAEVELGKDLAADIGEVELSEDLAADLAEVELGKDLAADLGEGEQGRDPAADIDLGEIEQGEDLAADVDLGEIEQGEDLGELAAPKGVEVEDAGLAPPIRKRAKTIALKRLTKDEQRVGALLYPERNYWRPKSRGECANAARPCPFVGCKYHLFIDVNVATGSIKLNAPALEVWEMQHSCALDIADSGGTTLEAIGEFLNITRERIRQVEVRGLSKLHQAAPQLSEYLGPPLEDL